MSSKQPSTARYLVGIDLGTTHTVVAYSDISKGYHPDQLAIFGIEQHVAAGEVAKRPLLPSFRYHPASGELADQDLQLPWPPSPLPDEIDQVVIGEWARELGAKVDGRLITSAKSWLSHLQVDRSAAILPWDAAEGVSKVSPVLASASYLNHVRQAWNHEHPVDLLENQEIVITVPASFDEVARALTVDAAKMAGLPSILLLEEPQAVCYAWYAKNRQQAPQLLNKLRLLMVCDIGGGTTDLSLIKIGIDNSKSSQPLSLTRIGVGDHLMLGGDNIDLALAHRAELRIAGSGKKFNAASLSQLIQQTRKAKESLLSAQAPESAKVTVLGSGARLIGGAKSCQLSRDEVHDIALDGFMPLTDFNEYPVKRHSAVVEFGLPYAADPAISKHIAVFLAHHQTACIEALATNPEHQQIAVPDALLLNGGVFNSPMLYQRSLDVISQWRSGPITALNNPNPDLAVAYGAVAYGMARSGAQLKIGGGSARSYFLRIDDDQQQVKQQGICLLPKGHEEDQEVHLSSQRFLLKLGEPVNFHLASSTADHHFQAGEIIKLDSDDFINLPPLIAVLDKQDSSTDTTDNNGADSNKETAEVTLAATLTAVGTLHIDCVSLADPKQRWHVEFQIRRDLASKHNTNNDITVPLPLKFKQAKQTIDDVYGPPKKNANPKAIKTLRYDLEKIIGSRDSWDIAILRALFDEFLAAVNNRRRSEAHERNWFNLAGFGLRPGFGATLDDWRIAQIWPLYHQGLQFNKVNASWSSWWTFWRRAAGGLNQSQQQQIFDDISHYIDPAALSKRKLMAELKTKSYDDMLRLAATFEQLAATTKTQIGNWLLIRLQKPSETAASWWALGRIGTRTPFHGSAHNVVPKEHVEQWLPQLLNTDWKKNKNIAFAAVMLTRMSGDRSRDINETLRHAVIDKLKKIKAPESWITMINEVVKLDAAETQRVFGEALPAGLKLID